MAGGAMYARNASTGEMWEVGWEVRVEWGLGDRYIPGPC